MASVATPTGVLRGVAPFTWDGAAWQPAGRAGPGVPTPTGTLDGVALYTWNGSAWTPNGGGTTPTPSGTLQGVAAFNWDGTAWQPSGRAGPEVPTPYGVLAGVALFAWNGAAWTPAPSLDLNFLNTTTLDPRVTFSRASTATYFDVTGVMQTAGTNVARFDFDPVTHASRGLMIEELRTNLLLNSSTLVTQDIIVTAQQYVLSFYGTGTVTLSGAFTGQLVGTGAFPVRAVGAFTPTAGDLTLTVTGTVQNAQLEAGAFVTSYIPTTSSALNRQPDVATLPSGAWRNSASETFATDILMVTTQNTTNPRILADAAGQHAPMAQMTSLQIQMWDGVAAFNTANSFSLGVPAKIAAAWSGSTGTLCLNGGAIATSGGLTAGFGSITTFRLLGDTAPTDQSNGYIRRFRYWPRVLSNTEMQQVTT